MDGLLGNKFRVIQAKRGYRVSEDAVILTWFAQPRPGEFILDAGTGCGVIAFGLCVKEPTVRVVGLEIQESLCGRAGRGALVNALAAKVSIVRGDLRCADLFLRAGFFDAIVSNPPYHRTGSGKANPRDEKALARHQIAMPPGELFRTSKVLLKSRGRLVLVFPAHGMNQLEAAMQETGFAGSRVLWIHPREGEPPSLCCLEATRTGESPTLLEDSLILYARPGVRSGRAQAILAGQEVPAANRPRP